MNKEEVMESFRKYFQSQGFLWKDSASLRATNPKLLFHISGGVVFEDIIEGRVIPLKSNRIVSVQRCLRTDNWRKIGISGKHHLFFEMMGHFSLYGEEEFKTKKTMIISAWEFLTQIIHLPDTRLIVTIHPQDRISRNIWKSITPGRIIEKRDNVSVSPHQRRSGLRTEIIWDKEREGFNYGRYVELWNIVFTQYDNPVFREPIMEKIAADSGMSFERLLMAKEDKITDYHTSIWHPIIKVIYQKAKKVIDEKIVFRLADTLRTAVVLLSEGILPGNKAENYVARRIIREIFMLFRKIQLPIDKLEEVINITASEVGGNSGLIETLIKEEYNRFVLCLKKGRIACERLLKQNRGYLSKENISFLKETYGYPPEHARQQETEYKTRI